MRDPKPRSPTPAHRMSDAYRMVWRWHFYAGVFVMPFLLLLTLTGGLYLFKDEIDQALYRPLIEVTARPHTTDPDQWLRAATEAADGTARSVTLPARADHAARVRVDREDGTQKTVFVDPYTARVTGITAYGGITETLRQLHSLSLWSGGVGVALNALIEIAAGWIIILCATGIYLWWPRRRAAVVVTMPKSSDARTRPFWRDVHALTGFYVGGVLCFLAVTGMPWSVIWGDQMMGAMRATGLGRPPAPAAASPWSHPEAHDAPSHVGWTLENAVLHAHDADHDRPSLSRVLDRAETEALPRPFTVSIPRSPDLAWVASRETRKAEEARSLYINSRSGALVADVGWQKFGPLAKGFEWGIAVHQGLQYGWINRIIMLIGCIAAWVLAISGLIMWWKRRPPSLSKRQLNAPAAAPHARAAVLWIVIPLSILYPLTGLSLLIALILDRVVSALTRPKRVTA